MNTTLRRLAAAAIAILPMAACSSTPVTLQKVDVQLKDPPKVVKRSLSGATLEFPFVVQNSANAVKVQVDYLDIEATINGSPMGHTKCRPAVQLDPGQERKMPIRYELSLISAGPGIVDAIVNKQATIAVEGTTRVILAQGGYSAEPLEYPISLK